MYKTAHKIIILYNTEPNGSSGNRASRNFSEETEASVFMNKRAVIA